MKNDKGQFCENKNTKIYQYSNKKTNAIAGDDDGPTPIFCRAQINSVSFLGRALEIVKKVVPGDSSLKFIV